MWLSLLRCISTCQILLHPKAPLRPDLAGVGSRSMCPACDDGATSQADHLSHSRAFPRLPARSLEAELQQETEGSAVVERVRDLTEVRGGEIAPWLGELRRIEEVDRFGSEIDCLVAAQRP